jgi:hypothetical protein
LADKRPLSDQSLAPEDKTMVRRQHMKDRGESSVSASALERYCRSFDAAERGDVGPALAHERRPLIHRAAAIESAPRPLSFAHKTADQEWVQFSPTPRGPCSTLTQAGVHFECFLRSERLHCGRDVGGVCRLVRRRHRHGIFHGGSGVIRGRFRSGLRQPSRSLGGG